MALVAAGLILGTAAGTASAPAVRAQCVPATAVRLAGGQTWLTTAPGIAGVLLHHDIVPIALLPGTAGAAAAGALDATFGTTLFQAGLELGTARTLLLF